MPVAVRQPRYRRLPARRRIRRRGLRDLGGWIGGRRDGLCWHRRSRRNPFSQHANHIRIVPNQFQMQPLCGCTLSRWWRIHQVRRMFVIVRELPFEPTLTLLHPPLLGVLLAALYFTTRSGKICSNISHSQYIRNRETENSGCHATGGGFL